MNLLVIAQNIFFKNMGKILGSMLRIFFAFFMRFGTLNYLCYMMVHFESIEAIEGAACCSSRVGIRTRFCN